MRSVNSIRRRAVPWVAAVVGVCACVALGQWQTRRAEQKLAIERAWAVAEAGQPEQLASASALAQVSAALPRRVALHGRLLHDKTVWVGNRIVDGRPGLYAVTPLAIDGGAGVVLINRGWMPRGPGDSAGALPRLSPSVDAPVHVVGLAVAHVPRILELGEDTGQRDLASVWPNLDYRRYERTSGLSVADFVVQQTSEAADGLTRKWPRPATGVDKHRGYAFQWYALAMLITVLAVVFGTRAWRNRRRSPASPSGSRKNDPHGEGA